MVMSINEKIGLVKRNTVEIIGEEELKKLLKEKKSPSVYIGTAPTGRPHVGYFIWGLKVADLLEAGFKVKILLADMHAALDNTPWNILDERYKYYERIIPLMIQAIGAGIKNLEFVKGSSFELTRDYIFDVLKMSSFTSIRDANKAASDVVKMGKNPKLSGLIYPIMQALDEQYLGVDAQLGGTDQRKIFVLARENHLKMGYKPRIEIMFPLLPGLIGEKMSASDERSKIDLLDDEKTIKNKLKNAEMIAGDSNNGVMIFLEHVIMTIKKDKREKFLVKRDKKYGGNLEYETYEEIKKDFIKKKLHPLDLKNAVAKEISELLKPIHKHKKELEKLAKKSWK